MHCPMLSTLNTRAEISLWNLVQLKLRNCRPSRRLKSVHGRNKGCVRTTIKTSALDKASLAPEESVTSPLTGDEECGMPIENISASSDGMLESNNISGLDESMLEETPLDAGPGFLCDEDSSWSDDMLNEYESEDEQLFADTDWAAETDGPDSDLLLEESVHHDHDCDVYSLEELDRLQIGLGGSA